MKKELIINTHLAIPEHELEISASRSGGPGGQHVNKTSSRITVRWNIKTTQILSQEQRERLLQKLANRLTAEGDLIISNCESRSQHHNKELALHHLVREVKKALHVPKKRMATKPSSQSQQARVEAKRHRSTIKQTRSKKIVNE